MEWAEKCYNELKSGRCFEILASMHHSAEKYE